MSLALSQRPFFFIRRLEAIPWRPCTQAPERAGTAWCLSEVKWSLVFSTTIKRHSSRSTSNIVATWQLPIPNETDPTRKYDGHNIKCTLTDQKKIIKIQHKNEA